MKLTLEDFKPGHFGSFGPRRVTREEILAFAAEFDPQPMHLDEEAAKRSMLKGLSGSGWHLCSIMMRMMFDGFIGRTASLGSPGVNELRWLAPLRPDDELTLDIDVTEARVSRSRPETGIVTFHGVVRNAAGEALCEVCCRSTRKGVCYEQLTVWKSCAKDEGGPLGIGFQERTPNQSKLLRSKDVVVSVGSKVRRKFGQVSIRETSASKPSLTRRNALDAVKTRGARTLWDKSAGYLVIGQMAAGV